MCFLTAGPQKWHLKAFVMYFSFLLFSHSVVSGSLQPHELQHTRLPCPSASPSLPESSRSLHQWCCPYISSSDTLFCFCPRSFSVSWTFPISHLFESDDQNTGVSASVFPVTIQNWFPLILTCLISLLSKGLLGVFIWYIKLTASFHSMNHNYTEVNLLGWPKSTFQFL